MSQKGKENKKEINWGLITASVCLMFNGILFLNNIAVTVNSDHDRSKGNHFMRELCAFKI